MLERLKSLLLLLLIAVTFHFTILYFTRVHASEPLLITPGNTVVDTPETDNIPKSYIDLFCPHYILFHNQGDHYRAGINEVQYDLLWAKLKDAISEVKNIGTSADPELMPVQAEQWQRMADFSVEYRFAGKMQLHYWWLTASKATLQKFPEDIYFDRLLVPLREQSVYLQNASSGQIWRWQWAASVNKPLFPSFERLAFTAEQRMRPVVAQDVSQIPGGQIFAPITTITLPEVLASLPITRANKADIVKRFFSIVPRVHKTEALGGGVVAESYITARQQVLTLQNTGLLSYREKPPGLPPDGAGESTIEQFEQAFNFILAKGGWPKGTVSAGMQATKVDDQSGYQFEFVQLYNDLPVLDFTPTFAVQVVPGGVYGFQRLTYNIIQPGYFQFEVRSVESALIRAAAAINSRAVSDVYLAYYQRPSHLDENTPFQAEPMYLYPVWTIELSSGERLFVHAYKLLNDPGVIRP